MRTYIKFSIYGLLLLLLLHFESLSLGPVKISHLWKGTVLFLIIFKIPKITKRNIYIYKPLLFLAFLQLINYDIILNPLSAIIASVSTLLFALSGIYFFRFNSKNLQRIILFTISFIILSFIPYKLGILESLGEGYDLIGYGVEVTGLIGPFQKVHTASTTLAGALIIVLYFLFSSKFNKVYLSLLFTLGFYFLFYTYVRTGMVMFAIGSLPILFHFGKKSVKHFSRIIILSLSVFFLLSTWVLSNETLLRRITGERDSYQEDSIETIGSGRVFFLIKSLEIFVEENLYEKLIGIGEKDQLNRMKDKIGLALVPHNGFLLLLLANGILGLFLFFSFIKRVYKYQRNSTTDESSLLRGVLLSYLLMTFFQSYDIIYMFLLLSLCIALTRIKSIESLNTIIK